MHIRLLNASEYPPLLYEIVDSPKKLHIRGEIPNWNKYKILCVVGSRKLSEYGKNVTEKIIEGLKDYPIIIVSGLAIGTDAYAHECAIKAGLKTVALPGSGLDDSVLYPRSNLSLAQRILENGGSLMSEFDPELKAAPYTFPQRNRVMAGMSHATLIIECAPLSGTLITARLAMEYNREVMTVPGSIFNENSIGPHSLINNGAKLVQNSLDVLEALNLQIEKVSEMDISDLTSDEIIILEKLNEPISRDDLQEILNFNISKFNSLLSSLEIKGIIKESMGKIFRK